MLSLNLQTRFKAEATNGALDAALGVNYATADLALYSLPKRRMDMDERFKEANDLLDRREAAKILNRRDNYAAAFEHAFGDVAA
ncbi:MAG: hypothetical protein ACK5Y6_10640 [Pseudomonadota bacterium]|jgi:hypothetical protein